MQEEQSDTIHYLPEELNPHHAEAPNDPASEPFPSNEDHATASQNDAGHSTINISSKESLDDDTLGSSLVPNHSNNPKPKDNPGPEEMEQHDDDEFDDDDEEMPSSPLDEDELNRPPEDMEHEEDVPNNLPPTLPPAKEDKSKTLKLFSLETRQRTPSALTPVDTNSVEPILAGLNKWYDCPGRNRDKEEDRTHLEWLAALIATSDKDSSLRKSYNAALNQKWPLSDTMYWITFIAKFSPIVMTLACIPSSIPPNTLWTPILPIAFINSTDEVDGMTAAIANSWMFSNPLSRW